jgi:hypothetical protein
MYAYLSPLLMINQPDYLTVRLNQARGGYRCPLGSKADIASTNRIVDVAGLDFGVFLSPDYLNLAGCCCSTKTSARVHLSLNFGLAAKAPKRDDCHRCRYPNLGNTNYV